MTNRYPPPPPDEPVIGGGYAPRTAFPQEDEPVIGGVVEPHAPPAAPAWDDDYDDQYDEYDEYAYDDDGEYQDEPPRSALVYVAIGLGVVLLVLAVVGAFALFGGNGDDGPSADFNLRIDVPRDGERITLGQTVDISTQASSNEPIVRFELLLDGEVVDSQDVAEPAAGVVNRATFQRTFDERGDHELVVRVTAESGDTEDSEPVHIVIIEPITEEPVEIEGEVLAAVNARTGPGESYPAIGSLRAGETVTIRGKSRDLEWLLVDSSAGDGLWVRTNGIEPRDALALVPVLEVTPTPAPSPTEQPTDEPSSTATPDASLPDLAPAGAVLVDGGAMLQVTIINNGGGDYDGGLVVSVSGVTGGSLTQAFSVSLASGGSDVVLLDVPAISEQVVARVTVDPDNAVDEGAEDNNAGSFTVNPFIQPPALAISYSVGAGGVTAEVINSGGDLDTSVLEVCVVVQDSSGAQTSKCVSATISLAGGQATSFTISDPPTGTGLLTLTVDGAQVASTSITLD